MTDKPLLAVVYSPRSRPWMEISEMASDLCRILWVVDESELDTTAKAIRKVGKVVNVEGLCPEEVIQRVDAERPDGITCYFDTDLHRQAWLAAALGLPSTSVRAVARLNDKLLQRQALEEAGVPVPRFCEVKEGVDAEEIDRLVSIVGFPALLKPRNGTACRGIYLVENVSDLCRALDETEHPSTLIYEERMEDLPPTDAPYADRISVETIVSQGVHSHLGVTGLFPMMPPFRSQGGFFPADLPKSDIPEVFDLVTSAIKALGSDFGCYRTEIKLTPQGRKIIEINGRPTGLSPATIKLASGVQLMKLGMRLALGEHVVVDGPVPCERIAYRFYREPPLTATKVTGITGLHQLGEKAGVLQIDVHKEVGDPVDWRNGSLDKVFQVTGTVGDYAELADAYSACSADSYVTYEHEA
ncbi:MAG TPA: ATP-grasp domain-containing protein [Acidimicrobiales bacterium]|nr:ATP-grasp domain-containing protein [Acidimicrobiales bacterium]